MISLIFESSFFRYRRTLFFSKHGTTQMLTNTRTLISMNIRTQLYLYDHLRETEPSDLKIDEITTGISLSTVVFTSSAYCAFISKPPLEINPSFYSSTPSVNGMLQCANKHIMSGPFLTHHVLVWSITKREFCIS